MKTENNNLRNNNQDIYKSSQNIDLINNNKDEYTVLDKTEMKDIYNDFNSIKEDSDGLESLLELEKITKRDISIDDRFSNARELRRYDDIAEIIQNDQLKSRNYKNFQKNNMKFYKSIEEQIFEETKRILAIDNLDVFQPESLDEINLVGDKYLTINNDINTIISVVADKDKKFLDLISDDSKNSSLQKPEFMDLKINPNDLKKLNVEENNKIESKEIETIPPYNQELNNLNVLEESNKSENILPPPPPIVPKTIPIVEIINSSDIHNEAVNFDNKTQTINNIPPPPPPVPVVPTTVLNKTNTPPPLPEIVKPSSDLDDTEYEKIKKYVHTYNNSQKDAIANGIGNIQVSDALKVNLYKNFYLNKNDLLDSKKEQDKNLNNMVNEYEKTLKDINEYEVKKEIRAFENKTVPFTSTIASTKENLNKEVLNTQFIQSENKELKNKIKELETKITDNLKNKQVLKIENKISEKETISPINFNKVNDAKQESPITNSKKLGLQEIANNTLKPFNDPNVEVVSLENTNSKKPILFKEKTNLSIYSLAKNNEPDTKKVSLNDALNKKKNALFSSFNANTANKINDKDSKNDNKPQFLSINDATKKKL